MARRQNVWAAKARLALIEKMGGKCVDCGTTEKLEFEHPKGRDYDPSKKSSSGRMSIYRREWAEGKLELCCGSCNLKRRKKNGSGAFIPTKDHDDNNPF